MAGSAGSPISQSFIQTIYDINRPAVVNCPVAGSPVNFRQLYGEIQSVSFSGHGIILFNDKWFYSNDNYATCSLFNGGGKSTFSAAVKWVIIPNR